MSPDAVAVGAAVRIAGSRGTWTVRRTRGAADGSVLVFGGTAMHERFRAVTPDKLRPAKPGKARR